MLLRYRPVNTLLLGLYMYRIPDGKNLTLVDEGKHTSKKQAKKLEQVRRQLAQKNVGNLAILEVSQDWLVASGSMEGFEYLGVFAAIFFVNAFLTFGVVALLRTPGNPLVYWMASFLCFLSLFLTAKSTVLSSHTKKLDKYVMIALASFGFLVFYTVLRYASTLQIDFDIHSAAIELGNTMTEMIRARTGKLVKGPAFTLHISPLLLNVILAAFAATFGAVSLNPGLRAGRMTFNASYPPRWARDYMTFSRLTLLTMHVAYVLPCLLAISAVQPMMTPFKLERNVLLWLRAALSLAAGLAQIATLRPLLQSYLNGVLVEWYVLKHSGVADDGTLQRTTRWRADSMNMLLVKVASEHLGPAVALSALGAVQLLSLGTAVLLDAQQPAFLPEAAGALASFVGGAWALYSSAGLLLIRFGIVRL